MSEGREVYRIRGLVWKQVGPFSWEAETPFGSYEVWANEWFDLVEFSHHCHSIRDGQAAAEAHYRARLLQALAPVRDEKEGGDGR